MNKESMKVKYHIPTEQFGFLEVDSESATPISYEEVKAMFIKTEIKALSMSDFIIPLIQYIEEDKVTGDPAMFEKMSIEQRSVFTKLKNKLARLNYKNPKGNVHHSLETPK